MDKFCKDCKHALDGDGPYGLRCGHPNNSVPSVDEAKYLVSGIAQPVIMAMRGINCAVLRKQHIPEILKVICGPDGKWFEPKEGI